MTSKDLYKLKLIDDIIKEPLGSAYRNPHGAFINVKDYIISKLNELKTIRLEKLLEDRYAKLRGIGLESQTLAK